MTSPINAKVQNYMNQGFSKEKAKVLATSRSISNKNVSPALKKIVKEMLKNIKENKPNIELASY